MHRSPDRQRLDKHRRNTRASCSSVPCCNVPTGMHRPGSTRQETHLSCGQVSHHPAQQPHDNNGSFVERLVHQSHRPDTPRTKVILCSESKRRPAESSFAEKVQHNTIPGYSQVLAATLSVYQQKHNETVACLSPFIRAAIGTQKLPPAPHVPARPPDVRPCISRQNQAPATMPHIRPHCVFSPSTTPKQYLCYAESSASCCPRLGFHTAFDTYGFSCTEEENKGKQAGR